MHMISLLAIAPLATARPSFTSANGALLADGKPMELKGINWYGFETAQGVFHGLYAQPPSIFLDLLETHGFNAVRIPLDVDLLLDDRKHGYIKPEPWEANATHCGGEIDLLLGVGYCPSALMKKSALQTLDWFVDELGKRGILVLFDMHCLSTAGTNASPVFYDSTRETAVPARTAVNQVA